MIGNFTYQGYDLSCLFISDECVLNNLTGQELWIWGYNSNGELGNNSIVNRCVPAQTIGGGNNWKQVAAGCIHTAGIKTDGTLWGWGANYNGQLGDETITKKSSPVQTVSGGTNWKQVAVGHTFSAAIKTDGTLWTWGYNPNGQLGDNTVISKSSPVQTSAGGNSWKQVAAAGSFGSAIKTDGTLWSWGLNTSGQLGDGTTDNKSSPVQTTSATTNWKYVSLGIGSRHAAAIKTDGTLWNWGDIPASGNILSPVQVSVGSTNWKTVSIGMCHSMAIKTDGTLWAWGSNFYGQLGLGDTTTRSSPVAVAGSNWKTVSAGNGHTVAIKTDGTLWSWGYNVYGQLGSGDIANVSSPVQTTAINSWRSLSVGMYDTSAALKITEG